MRDGILQRFHNFHGGLFGAQTALGLCLLAGVLAGTAGCKVKVDKSGDGGSDNLKIATPFGGISVNKDQTSAAELGLPPYPGATTDTGGDGNQSAKVDMGFGSWKLRVKVAHYSTADSRDQVLAFYRKALSEYGAVIECAGNQPVGTPVKTREGLSCSDSGHDHSDHGTPYTSFDSGDVELKAGSPHHQHLLVLKGGGASATQFSLIALDLPHGFDNQQEGTN
jgi:hypothetical protein